MAVAFGKRRIHDELLIVRNTKRCPKRQEPVALVSREPCASVLPLCHHHSLGDRFFTGGEQAFVGTGCRVQNVDNSATPVFSPNHDVTICGGSVCLHHSTYADATEGFPRSTDCLEDLERLNCVCAQGCKRESDGSQSKQTTDGWSRSRVVRKLFKKA